MRKPKEYAIGPRSDGIPRTLIPPHKIPKWAKNAPGMEKQVIDPKHAKTGIIARGISSIEERASEVKATKRIAFVRKVEAAVILGTIDELQAWIELLGDPNPHIRYLALTYLTDRRDGKSHQKMDNDMMSHMNTLADRLMAARSGQVLPLPKIDQNSAGDDISFEKQILEGETTSAEEQALEFDPPAPPCEDTK